MPLTSFRARQTEPLSPFIPTPLPDFYDAFYFDDREWVVVSGTWGIRSDQYVSPPHSYAYTGDGAARIVYANTPNLANCLGEAMIRINQATVNLHAGGLLLRYVDGNNLYMFRLVWYAMAPNYRVQLLRFVGGVATILSEVAYVWAVNTWYRIRLTAVNEGTGVRLRGYVNDVEQINHFEDPRSHERGRIGFRPFQGVGNYVWIDNVIHRAI